MQSLTPEQEMLLRRPFTPGEHSFVNGRPYLRKDAIRRRLSQIDATWQTLSPTVVSMEGDVIVLAGALVVCGIARYDIGTGIIIRHNRDNKTGELRELPPYELARNSVRAYKTAASDLLPRCAVQFGVGEYLKTVPRNVVDERSLADWLRALNAGPVQQPVSTPAYAPAVPSQAAAQPAGANVRTRMPPPVRGR